MHQITPYKKYVIPIYKKLGFPNFQSFTASFSDFAACAKKTKDFQNVLRKKVPNALFNYFILKQFLRQIRTTGCKDVVPTLF
jgi:hypothetical protein